ncbi:hypothetical protein TNCV_331091 [Trichonephila clavipes]|nr:hypothetical protein TNCV_331091 [Trichonephila clavipes]
MFQILLWYPWKGKKEYVPLRTAYSQDSRYGMQPKARQSSRAGAAKTRTKTFELVEEKQKLLRIRERKRTREVREQLYKPKVLMYSLKTMATQQWRNGEHLGPPAKLEPLSYGYHAPLGDAPHSLRSSALRPKCDRGTITILSHRPMVTSRSQRKQEYFLHLLKVPGSPGFTRTYL